MGRIQVHFLIRHIPEHDEGNHPASGKNRNRHGRIPFPQLPIQIDLILYQFVPHQGQGSDIQGLNQFPPRKAAGREPVKSPIPTHINGSFPDADQLPHRLQHLF